MLGHGAVGHIDADALDALGLAGFAIDRQATTFHPAPLPAAVPVAEDHAVFPARVHALPYRPVKARKIHGIHQFAESALRTAEAAALQAEHFLEFRTPHHPLIVQVHGPDAHADQASGEQRFAR